MDGIRLVSRCAALYFMFAVCEGAVSWRNTGDVTLRIGERLELHCTATNIEPVGVVRIFKVNRGEDGSDLLVQSSNVLHSPFLGTPRYSRTYDYHANTKTADMSLKISGVQPEDAGEYRCNNMGSPLAGDFIKVDVLGPLQQVEIVTTHPNGTLDPAGADPVKLIYSEGSSVACQASTYGFRYPNITAFVNAVDETGRFQLQQQRQASGIGMYSVTTLNYSSTDPYFGFNGGRLLCEASLQGFPAKTAEVQLEVQYPPVFNCSQTDYRARPGDDLDMSCRVYGNPRPVLGWSYGATGEENTLQSPGEKPGLMARENNITSDLVESTLYIPKVDRTNYMTYKLRAKNMFGTRSETFRLTEGDKGPVQRATFTLPNLLAVLSSLLLAFIISY